MIPAAILALIPAAWKSFDPRPLRSVAVGVAMMLLYGSRLTRGRVRQTPDGPAFPIKPMFAWSRAIGLPAYVLFYGFIMISRSGKLPWFFPMLLAAAIALGVATLPATIVLTRDALTQRFWLRSNKAIAYADIAAIRTSPRGRRTRVLAVSGASITHTGNHSAHADFCAAIERLARAPLR